MCTGDMFGGSATALIPIGLAETGECRTLLRAAPITIGSRERFVQMDVLLFVAATSPRRGAIAHS